MPIEKRGEEWTQLLAPKSQIPVAEKMEDAGVKTMHGAQAKTYSGLTLAVPHFIC